MADKEKVQFMEHVTFEKDTEPIDFKHAAIVMMARAARRDPNGFEKCLEDMVKSCMKVEILDGE